MLLSNLDLLATAPGGVAKLRELILTLAVQGKLVPQDVRDEPASELLKKIRAEKDRLIAEGTIKKDKPQPEAEESEMPIGLRAGWEWAKGRELFSVVRGVTYQKSDARDTAADNYLPILRANNIRGSINLEDLVYVPSSLVSEDQRLRSGDYVVCLASGSKNLVGKVAPFYQSLECSFGAFCGVIRPIQEIAYLAVYLASPMYRDTVSAASAGIGINNLKGSSLLDLDIAVPPFAEQARIVTRVEELMGLCDALEAKGQLEAAQHAQLVQTLLGALTASNSPEELADNWQRVATHFDLLLDRPEAVDALEQTILQLAVRGLLVPQDRNDKPASELLMKIRTEKDKFIAESNIKRDKPLAPISLQDMPFVVPQNWEWCRLSDVALHGPTNGLSPRPIETPTDVRCLSLSATTQGFFRPECFKYVVVPAGQAEQFALKRGDLLIQRGNSIDYVGIAALYDGPDDAYIFPDLMMRVRLSQAVEAAYVQMAMVCIEGRDYFKRNATGTQGTMPKVNQATVGGAPLPLPPAPEMRRIVARVESLRRLCTDLRQRLAARQTTQAHLAEALVSSVSH